MSADGIPLCVNCHKEYENSLLSKKTIRENMWQTRFCSRTCMDEYWVGYSFIQYRKAGWGIYPDHKCRSDHFRLFLHFDHIVISGGSIIKVCFHYVPYNTTLYIFCGLPRCLYHVYHTHNFQKLLKLNVKMLCRKKK